ncbi:MAG: c-type cytochrome [Ignavibacteriae bacterium]|nr:c-type cytochrome [Ignavibacteriota bacterium]
MKILKRIAIVLGSLVGVVVLTVVVIYFMTRSRLNSTYEITPRAVLVPNDTATIARGRHWVDVYCTGCHGPDLAGKRMFEDPDIGSIDAPNLTRGRGGVASAYASDIDWVRSIRHGVRPSGQALFIMPSREYYYFSDEDLGSIISYIKSLPPVDKTTAGYELTFLSHILAAFGAFGSILSVEDIQHDVRPPAPPRDVTAAYGEYLVNTGGCRTCHGENLAGGKDPNPHAPPSPNLTPGGPLKSWTREDFLLTLRTGFTPDRRPLQAAFMPWDQFGRMTDNELTALWLYLRAQPALATND